VNISATGLANLQSREDQDNFQFIVGESHYQCPSFVADFLSPSDY
jgi:hypothetical protein